MQILEKSKLFYRANNYRYRLDRGGIAFIRSEINSGDTVMDIGAHKGGYLYFMRQKTGSTGRIFAFEPQKLLYYYLLKIKGIFGWKNVVLERIAISDTLGEVVLTIPKRNARSSSSPGASVVKDLIRIPLVEKETVPSETLDSYCSRMNIEPDFIKIDVEGNELNILKGGIETLKKYHPKIHIEIEIRHAGPDHARETFRLLEALDYSGHFVHGKNIVPLSAFTFQKNQNTGDKKNYCNNFLFTKAE